MNFVIISSISAMAINLTLGMLVFFTNPQRRINQSYLILSGAVMAWLVFFFSSFHASTDAEELFRIQQDHATGSFVLAAFNLLRLAIVHRTERWGEIFSRVNTRIWLIVSVAIAILCQTPIFIKHARLPAPGALAELQFGQAYFIYVIYFVTASSIFCFNLIQDIRHSTGIIKTELQFTFLGLATCFFVGATTAVIAPFVTGRSESVQLTPMWVIFLDTIIAYGIVTRRIMDVADVLRRFVAYTLLAVYLVALYSSIWFLGNRFFPTVLVQNFPLPSLLGALAVAFSLVPARGKFQQFAQHIYLTTPPIDAASIVRRVTSVLQSITTLPDLLQKFCMTVGESLGTDTVTVLVLENKVFTTKYGEAIREFSPIILSPDDPLVEHLRKSDQPIVKDELERFRQTSEIQAISKRMDELKMAFALGIRSRGTLQGILFLGPRLSGRVYGNVEQDALQVLCNQLAIAIENSQLFTGAQDSKIYNELLLENLVSGVVASSTEGIITVFNREAQQITRLSAAAVINKPAKTLPPSLAQLIYTTLQTGKSTREIEAKIDHGNESTTVRMGSSIFKGHSGNVLGVLVVIKDLTAVKKLEQQVRRTDRLASMGTLSAGMAHEIKNPLVAIKTFTQLLPERYQDQEFRESFSSVVGHEIDRIDGIVNQLLSFSRPVKPALAPTDLHKILDKSLKLVHHQMVQQGVTPHREFSVTPITIQADPHLLEQAILNLLLNAIEAMNRGGQLKVRTQMTLLSPLSEAGLTASPGSATVFIEDSGHGIKPEDLGHVFDPFFTTKSTGTGLGLSVSHQIIQEHGGEIEVESEWTKGTCFSITFPLPAEQQVAA